MTITFSSLAKRLVLALVFLTLSAQVGAQEARPGNVATTLSVVESLDEVRGHGDWVILDLDDTVMRDGQALGTDEWFFHEATRFMNERGGSLMDAFIALRPLNRIIKSFSNVILLESKLPAALNRVRAKGAVVFGLTSRDPQLSETTLRQLGSVGVSLGHSSLPVMDEFAKLDWDAMPSTQPVKFERGVFYTSGSNKGSILKSILGRVKTASLPAFVRTYDDRESNAQAFAKALAEFSIPSMNYEYKGGARETTQEWRMRLAAEQLKDFEAKGRTGPLLDDAGAAARLSTRSSACRAAF